MEVGEYARVAAAENDHWWFRNTRAVMADLLAPWLSGTAPGEARYLDAGCGPGGNGAWLSEYGSVVGVDRFMDALVFVQGRQLQMEPVQGSLDALPLRDEAFDAVACITVLTHLPDDARAVAELARVVRPGGAVMLMEPAFTMLRRSHDVMAHSLRRYRLPQLRRMAEEAGLTVQWGSYAYSFLAPPAAVLGLMWRLRPRPPAEAASDTARSGLTRTFTRLAEAERSWMRRRKVPFGTSVIALATKPGPARPSGAGRPGGATSGRD